MKSVIKILILLLISISFTLTGCFQEGYNVVSDQGFTLDTLEKTNLTMEKQPTFTEFKSELQDYKSFSNELFPVWQDHIDRTSSVLDDFNRSIVFEEKIKNSKELEQKYIEFKTNLEKIEPPLIAAGAYDLAVEAVSYRILFFKKFGENAPVKELDIIESRAYLAETSFWLEIDNIYKYFDKEISRVGTISEDKYIAFN